MKNRLLLLWLVLSTAQAAAGHAVEVVPREFRGAVQPQASIAPDGAVYVVFGKGERIYCSVSHDRAGTFLAPQEVGSVPRLALGMRRGPRVAVTRKNIVVSAISHETGNVCAWTSPDGGQHWSSPKVINSAPGSAREGLHGMAGDPSGNLFATWLDVRNGSGEIWGAASHDAGQNWSANVKIYASPDGHVCECCHPSVEIGSNGVVRVMWRNWLGGSRDMYTAVSRNSGKTFGAAVKLGSGTWPLNACPMDGGSLAGSYEVWRREQTVFSTGPGSPLEHPLGKGKQPVVALGSNGPRFLWQNGAQLLESNAG